jgi:hypothetical protein
MGDLLVPPSKELVILHIGVVVSWCLKEVNNEVVEANIAESVMLVGPLLGIGEVKVKLD